MPPCASHSSADVRELVQAADRLLRGVAVEARNRRDFAAEAEALGDALRAFVATVLHQPLATVLPDSATVEHAFENANGDMRFDLTLTVARLAKAVFDRGDPEQALPWCELGVILLEQSPDPDAPLMAGRLAVTHAVALRLLNRYGDAEARLEIAEALLASAPLSDEVGLAFARAQVAYRTGRTESAVEHLRALEVRLDPARHPVEAGLAMANLAMLADGPAGDFCSATRRLERARALLSMSGAHDRLGEIEQSLALFAVLSRDPRALDMAVRALARCARHPRPDIVWRTLEAAAVACVQAGRSGLGLLLLKQAVDRIEVMRLQRAEADFDLAELQHDGVAFVFDQLSRLLVEAGRLGEARGVLARKLPLAHLPEAPPPVALTQAEEAVGTTLAAALSAQASEYDPDALARTLQVIDTQLAGAQVRVRAQALALDLALREAHRARLPPSARANTLVLQVMQDQTHVAMLASVDGQDLFDANTTPVLPAREINELAHAFINALLACDNGAIRRVGRALHCQLVEPGLRRCPPGVSRVLIAASGTLHGLPWAALPDADGQPLLRSFDLVRSTVPAVDLARAPRMPMNVLACSAEAGGAGHPPLPHALEEVRSLLAETQLSGVRDFNGPALKAALPRANVLHLASHFVADPANLLRSYLLLGDGTHLPLHDLARQDLAHLDLLVLSACDSAATGAGGASAAFAVDQILLSSGIPSVIGMLYPVADHATAELMRRFHAHLRRGIDKARALALAQRALLEGAADPDWRQAYFWAAPVLSGNWLGWSPT